MPLSLPLPIAAYFVADAADGTAVADCFTADAMVIDEKQTHQGRDAIARWKKEASAKFDYTVQPTAFEAQGDRLMVTARVTGNFPGSPVNLHYAFTLAGDAIARLEIVP
ncbi:nuclear transport factor 2 family protein [Niveispirillum sp. SYP-B3756]|uniref:nuclear transport factor 2 family protein n=1 Tax=Niveispirillum sp. SYP-B3756 TaxID=2662178 RepID=UPI001291495C|nr:nuclear transport factor 2 family protein [Niveispirillum sp. SYP-B3756]MQP63879.1 nuclear transport factor 2 family protein [Niveispirillum sp. SYP-B3756]